MNVRLPQYQLFINASALVSPTTLGLTIYFFPEYFSFLGNLDIILGLFAAIFVFHLVFMIVEHFTHNKGYFAFPRYAWIVVFFSMVYVSGGVASPVIYLLILPYLVSTVDLNAKDTLIVSYLTMFFLGGLFVIDMIGGRTMLVGQHFFTLFIFGVISFYMYRLVKETLHERFEKEEVKAEVARLLELDKVKSDFITVASHRLRTPLSGVMWALSELGSKNSDFMSITKRKEIEASALRETNNAITIVNDLIKSVEIDSQNYKLRPEPLDLEIFLHEIVESLSWLARKNNVTVSTTGGKVENFSGDRNLLRLAFTNIIDNAIRYSPGRNARISWTIRGGVIEIEVSDSGIGISHEDMKYIFERFYRGKDALSLEPNASGVGLYVAKKIIKLHGGRVSIDSEQDKGTRVVINLPING